MKFTPDPKKKRIEVKRGTVAWKKLVKSLFERDGYTCIDCNMKLPYEYLAPCHIKSVGSGGDDILENLRTKCKFCHNDEHMGVK